MDLVAADNTFLNQAKDLAKWLGYDEQKLCKQWPGMSEQERELVFEKFADDACLAAESLIVDPSLQARDESEDPPSIWDHRVTNNANAAQHMGLLDKYEEKPQRVSEKKTRSGKLGIEYPIENLKKFLSEPALISLFSRDKIEIARKYLKKYERPRIRYKKKEVLNIKGEIISTSMSRQIKHKGAPQAYLSIARESGKKHATEVRRIIEDAASLGNNLSENIPIQNQPEPFRLDVKVLKTGNLRLGILKKIHKASGQNTEKSKYSEVSVFENAKGRYKSSWARAAKEFRINMLVKLGKQYPQADCGYLNWSLDICHGLVPNAEHFSCAWHWPELYKVIELIKKISFVQEKRHSLGRQFGQLGDLTHQRRIATF
jgi:hypothetical protein